MYVAPQAKLADPRTGTPGCIPPEVALGRANAIRKELDVFLLGALLYRILAGEMPFTADDQLLAIKKAAANHKKPLREMHEDISPRLQKLVEQAMSSSLISDPPSRSLMNRCVLGYAMLL